MKNGWLLTGVRGFRLVLHLLVGFVLVTVVNASLGRIRPEPLTRWWNSLLLDILNIELRVHGRGVRGARLLVANHVSWLDIPVIAASENTRFVAKSEIRRWPVAGWLANAAGSFYIRRGAGGAKPLLQKVGPHLAGGGSFVLFPEGTTTDGRSVQKFHPRLFQAAVDYRCPVQPLALRYARGADGRDIAPFIGDDDLFSHILRVLREPCLRVDLHYCAAIAPGESDRQTLAQIAQARIAAVVAPQVGTDENAIERLAPATA